MKKIIFYFYEKYNDNNKIHNIVDLKNLKKYYSNIISMMNNEIFRKFYIQCLFLENQINNFIQMQKQIVNKFRDIKFKLWKAS